MRLDDRLILRTSDRYAFPLRSGEKLPVVFGDHIDPLTRGGAEDLGGCLPTVCVDRLNLWYLLSDCAVPAQNIEIYGQQNSPVPVLQDASTYTFYPSLDLEGLGAIAAVQFTLGSVLNMTITWRGVGALDNANQVIADPVTAMFLLFIARGNWVAADFDQISLTRAQGLSVQYGIPVHYVIQEDQTYAQILTDLFENYLADVRLTSEGKLAIVYNLWPMEPIHHNEVAQPYVDALTDVVGDDPEDAVELILDRDNLINEAIVRWRHNWATNEQMAETDFTYVASQSAYRVRRPREFTLRGIRLQSHLNVWLQLFLSPLVEDPTIVEIPLKAMMPYLHMQRGSYVALTWSAGPDPLNRGWTNRVLRVLETRTNYMAQTHTLRAFDTKLSVIPPQAAPFLDQNGVTWYLRIASETGSLEFVSTLTFPWVSSGTARHWVTRLSPTNQTVYIYPSLAGAVLSSTTQPSAGTGNSAQVSLVDWTMRHWDIQVGASPGFAVTTRVRNLGVKLIGVT